MKMGFERCHPAVNLIYFAAVLVGMITFQHPVFLVISFLCAFAYSVKRNGWKAVVFNLCLLPFVVAFALYYSSYTHFGMTVLHQNMVGNNMTLESLVYGAVLGVTGAGVCIWFSCVFSVFTTDKVVYLFGKVSPRLSLFLAILLRMIPRIKKEAKRINMAQQGIGRGANQGNLWQRFRNSLRIFSMLITWTIDSLTIASESMCSRGSSLRRRKAFSIYRFDNRDRLFVIGLFLCLTLTMMAVLLGQTDMVYDPKIIWTQVNPLFCIGYGVLCLMPFGLELWTEYRFQKARRSI
jgi:energy-coupling factor transport system permease protein